MNQQGKIVPHVFTQLLIQASRDLSILAADILDRAQYLILIVKKLELLFERHPQQVGYLRFIRVDDRLRKLFIVPFHYVRGDLQIVYKLMPLFIEQHRAARRILIMIQIRLDTKPDQPLLLMHHKNSWLLDKHKV